MALVLDHDIEGTSVLPNAIFITPASTPDSAEMHLWTTHKIEHVHEKAGVQFSFPKHPLRNYTQYLFPCSHVVYDDYSFRGQCLV
jgi:hypothetical protein